MIRNPEGPHRGTIKVSFRLTPGEEPRRFHRTPVWPSKRLDSRTLILGLTITLLVIVAGTLGLWLMDARTEAANLRSGKSRAMEHGK